MKQSLRAEWLPALAVARLLTTIEARPVVVGGLAAGLLVTDPAASQPRPTYDIDLVVEASSLAAYHRLGKKLRASGFEEDETSGVLCRWTYDGSTVDIMPTAGEALGLNTRWFGEAYSSAHEVTFGRRGSLWVVGAAYFLALKLEAFRDRGEADYIASHDLEDMISVVNGREETAAELAAAEPRVRAYVAAEVAALLEERAFVEALPGHLDGDDASQARLPIVTARLGRLASPP